MQRRLSFIATIIFLLLFSRAGAKHIFGGELLYTHLTGNQYKITLTLYGDCSADPQLFDQLYNARPLVEVLNNNTIFIDSIGLAPEAGSGAEVSAVCPAQLSQTVCNGGTLPGVRQFIYSNVVTLPTASSRWRFIFDGKLGVDASGISYSAGRSDNITNASAGTQIQLEAMLNNVLAANSSPLYSTIPTPYYCVNVLQQYNHGASDPDNDSLAFALVPAINEQTGGPVSYLYPYTATAPMATAAGGFVFNHFNGQMTFTPNATQDALIVNQVSEYRGGVLVGTSEREMTFIVQDNCDGTPPTPNVASVTGGVVSDGTTINVCRGEPSVSFTIALSNPDGDATDITPNSVPSTASLTVNNNHTASPTVDFSWATGSLPVGHYTFYLTIKNNHCPLYNVQTVAYTINVAAVPSIHARQLTQTNCISPAAVQYDLQYGFAPRNIIVMSGTAVVKTLVDNTAGDTAVVIDSLPAGAYTIIVRSDMLCTDTVSLVITDSGRIPVAPVALSYCLDDPSLPVYIAPVVAGASISWFNTDSSSLPFAPVVNTFSSGVYEWYFIESYSVCSSGPVPVTATVHNRPDAQIVNIPQTVCYGDAVYLQATGGVKYDWEPADAIKQDTGLYIEIISPTTVIVNVTDTFGCKDTASVTYSDIQLCCLFSYPNAFTPNRDGHNDGFRVVTYGNMKYYSLTIFNRWGQQVFFTADPMKRWDGTFKGQLCDPGVYYYYMNAECLTGPKEQHKGDVMLIR